MIWVGRGLYGSNGVGSWETGKVLMEEGARLFENME